MISIPIDRQGRLVLPRAVRQRLGIPIGEDGRLCVWESADGVVIELMPRESEVGAGEDGLPVLHVSDLGEVNNETVVAAIHHDRATRRCSTPPLYVRAFEDAAPLNLGGQIHDYLIALTCAHYNCSLVTADRRQASLARPILEESGQQVTLLVP